MAGDGGRWREMAGDAPELRSPVAGSAPWRAASHRGPTPGRVALLWRGGGSAAAAGGVGALLQHGDETAHVHYKKQQKKQQEKALISTGGARFGPGRAGPGRGGAGAERVLLRAEAADRYSVSTLGNLATLLYEVP